MPRIPISRTASPRVERAMESVGTSIRVARLARSITQTELAQRGGLGLATLKRLEAGHAGIAIGHVLACLEILGLMSSFVASIAPAADAEGQVRRASQRQRARKRGGDDYDF